MRTYNKTLVRNNRHFSQRYFYSGHYQNKTKIRLTRFNSKRMETETVDPSVGSFRALVDDDCVNWFQVQGLSDDRNITRMISEFGMHSLDARDVLTPAHVVKIDENDDYFTVVLNSCSISNDHRIHSDHVSLIVTEKIVLSFNEGQAPLFENVDRALEQNIMDIRGQKSGMIFAFLLNAIIVDLIETASKVESQLERIEDQLLGKQYNQRNLGTKIQECRHASLILRKNTVPLKHQFYQLQKTKSGIITSQLLPVFRDLEDQLEFVDQTICNSTDMLMSLVDLYVSDNDFKMNAVMKRLTVVSTLFAPITFLVGVWGMNFRYMPELDNPYGYAIAWTVIIGVVSFTWSYMKRKGWF